MVVFFRKKNRYCEIYSLSQIFQYVLLNYLSNSLSHLFYVGGFRLGYLLSLGTSMVELRTSVVQNTSAITPYASYMVLVLSAPPRGLRSYDSDKIHPARVGCYSISPRLGFEPWLWKMHLPVTTPFASYDIFVLSAPWEVFVYMIAIMSTPREWVVIRYFHGWASSLGCEKCICQ